MYHSEASQLLSDAALAIPSCSMCICHMLPPATLCFRCKPNEMWMTPHCVHAQAGSQDGNALILVRGSDRQHRCATPQVRLCKTLRRRFGIQLAAAQARVLLSPSQLSGVLCAQRPLRPATRFCGEEKDDTGVAFAVAAVAMAVACATIVFAQVATKGLWHDLVSAARHFGPYCAAPLDLNASVLIHCNGVMQAPATRWSSPSSW